VVDGGGRPLAGAIVRTASRLLRNQQPVRADGTGHFRIELPSLPVDFVTGERVMKHSLIAFMPHDERCGMTRIDLESAGHPAEVVVSLAEHPPGWIFEAISSEMTDWERGRPSDESLSKMTPEMQRGKRPPVLDCREWLSVENGEQSLEAFHGKYVLLDFWTTWCGPCLADAPSLEMVHELYGDRVTVIGVHDNSVPIEEIRKFITDHEVPYPIAIDHEDGRTLKAYENVGITGYPSYILLDTEGRIVACDRTIPAPTLRSFKVEWVRQVLLENTEQ